MGKYDDIIHLERPVSKNHTPMPLQNRASQFAPFAALTGYDDAVEETARLTDRKIELSEDERARLDEKIGAIYEYPGNKPDIIVTYFVKDSSKSGGKYEKKEGLLKKIDDLERILIFSDGTRVRIDDILDIEIK